MVKCCSRDQYILHVYSFIPPFSFLPLSPPLPLPSLSFFPQLTERHNDDSTQSVLDPIYFPLDPGDCMCSTMQEAADNLHNLTAFPCDITDEECTTIRCTISDNPPGSVTTRISPCDDPPSLHTTVVMNGDTQNIDTSGNLTTTLNDIPADLKITIWHFDYSMDVEVS